MKLCKMTIDGETHLAAKCGRGVVDLTAAGLSASMNAIIENSDIMLDIIASMCEDTRLPALDESGLSFACVTEPSKLVCVGLNYKNHAEETGVQQPDFPVLFSKFNDCLTHHGAGIALPETVYRFDYEAELVIVVGKTAWNITPEQAGHHIFGYTCGNDLSARDSQFISSQWLIGKAFPGFGPAGPYITTAGSFDPKQRHEIYCEVNGARVQSGYTGDMIFGCAELVSYISRYIRLNPGDLIFTGTPPGVTLGKNGPERVWLKSGDRVAVTIDGLGTLENTLS